MEKLFGQIVAQFRDFYKNLTPTRRLSLVGSATVAFAAIVLLVYFASGRDYVPLFLNVSSDQVGLIVDQLKQKNVPFKMDDGGTTISVPAEILHSTQMSLMAEIGSEKLSTSGLELFEKQDFGVTSFAQQINYQRALQGELMRAINTLDSVKRSKVLLALPAKKTFLEESGKPTASVVVDLYPGKTLSQEQIKGIRYLVSSSVQRLDVGDVTVVDSRGKMLSSPTRSDAQASSEFIQLQAGIESSLQNRIEDILSKLVGQGKVIAKVDVQLNTQARTIVSESVDADRAAVRSVTTEEESLNGARTNPVGIPGSRANLPGADDAAQVGLSQNIKKELKTTNYDVPKTVTNTKDAGGSVRKISVAVVVDGVTMPDEENEGATKWMPRSQEELAKFEQLVRKAVGIDEARGDSLTIESIRFQEEDFVEAERLLTTLERKKLLHALLKWSLLGLSLALFFFMIVRPFVAWITDRFQDSVDEMLPRTLEELEELQTLEGGLPGMRGVIPVLEDSLDPDKAESELLKERIMAILEDNEPKAAGAFGIWLSKRD